MLIPLQGLKPLGELSYDCGYSSTKYHLANNSHHCMIFALVPDSGISLAVAVLVLSRSTNNQ